MVLCVAGGVMAEIVGYRMLFSTDKYVAARASYARLQSAVERTEAKPDTGKERGLAVLKQSLKDAGRNLAIMKLYVTAATGVLMFALFWLVNNVLGGATVVLRLPFSPPPLVQSLSHMGLDGDDYRECSAAFVYALASMSLRAYAVRLIALTPADDADTPSLFQMPEGLDDDDNKSVTTTEKLRKAK